jgi:hypothetical protein
LFGKNNTVYEETVRATIFAPTFDFSETSIAGINGFHHIFETRDETIETSSFHLNEKLIVWKIQ